MNPANAQDVPRAVELLKAIGKILLYPSNCRSLTEQHEAAELCVIGEMLNAFLDAFFNVELSITQQVTLLSKYVHLAFALFWHHHVNFMPNQLYIDSQTTVKNAIFCIAKQKALHDTQPFYLFMTEDNCLENFFVHVRMLGGHNPNCSYKQLQYRTLP